MPKVSKKSAKNLKRKSTKRNDFALAVLLGSVITIAGLVITRYSSASSNASFRRDPVKQMQGGEVVRKTKNTLARIASETAPGVNPVYTLVSKQEMINTLKVCAEYTVKQRGTWINLEYHSKTQGLATSIGTTKNSGSGVECVTTGGQAEDGTININVTPGAAEITKVYGVLRAYND